MDYIDILVHLSNVLPVLALKITVLAIGYSIVKIGKELLEKGITGQFKFTIKSKGLETNLVSGLPGLLFLLLGVLLMGYAIFKDKPIETIITKEIQNFSNSTTNEPPNNSQIRPKSPDLIK